MKKILLIQFIQEKEFREKEIEKYLSIFNKLNMNNIILEKINPFENEIKIEILKKYNRIILGGSNLSFQGIKNYDQEIINQIIKKIKIPILNLIELKIPTLAICFGHQFIAHLNGSEIKKIESKSKSGSYKIEILKKDKIFKNLPKEFYANYMHHDSLNHIPCSAVLLAKGEKCDFAMLKYGKNFYSTQFHPELDNDHLGDILKLRPEYLPKNKKIEKLLTNTEKSHLILKNFIEEDL